MGGVDGGSVNAFLAAALTRVMRATVPIPVLLLWCILLMLVDVGSKLKKAFSGEAFKKAFSGDFNVSYSSC